MTTDQSLSESHLVSHLNHMWITVIHSHFSLSIHVDFFLYFARRI